MEMVFIYLPTMYVLGIRKTISNYIIYLWVKKVDQVNILYF